jgi:hypothetical protein
VSGQLHAPAALLPEERAPGTHWIGSWVGPRTGLNDVEKMTFLSMPGLELRPLCRSSPLPVVIPTALSQFLSSSNTENISRRHEKCSRPEFWTRSLKSLQLNITQSVTNRSGGSWHYVSRVFDITSVRQTTYFHGLSEQAEVFLKHCLWIVRELN